VSTLRAQLRRTNRYVAWLAAHTRPLNWLCLRERGTTSFDLDGSGWSHSGYDKWRQKVKDEWFLTR
jgi:hypothetical protein